MRIFMLLFYLLKILLRVFMKPFAGLIDRLTHGAAPDTFRDHDRRRSIPYRVYEPEGVEGPAPVVLFSHGMGGTKDAAPYLGKALAAAGFWGIFLQHPGSDRSVMKGAGSRDQAMARLKRSMFDPNNMRDRFLDVPFVLDELERQNITAGSRFFGRIDLSAGAGIAGHSYGARSVMAAAGQRMPRVALAYKEKRIRAGIALSPSATRMPGMAEQTNPEADYAHIEIPLMHVTGTLDGAGPGMGGTAEQDAPMRTLPYKMTQAPEQYLLVFDGATHGNFSGAGLGAGPEDDLPDTRYTRTTALAAVLFFNAYLKGDEAAREALRQEFPAALAPRDRYEFK